MSAADAPAPPASAPPPPSGGLAARVARGVGALGLGAVVKIVGQLSIVPIAMAAWGEARYGEWLVLAGLVTVLSLTDVGLQNFVVNRMTASYARGDREELHRLLHSALRVQLPLAAAVLAVLGATVAFIPMRRMLELVTVSWLESKVVVMLLAVELLVGVPMGVIAGVYRATGRLPRAAAISAVQQSVVLGGMMGMIAAGASFGVVAAVRVGIAAAASLFVAWDLRRVYPWLRLWPDSGTLREGFAMVLPGALFLLIPMADFLGSQGMVLAIQRSLSGAEVSQFSTHRTVVNMAVMVSGMLTVAVWPELTALHAGEKGHTLRAVQRTLVKLNVWIVGGVSLALLPLLPRVYPAWTSGRLRLDGVVAAVLIARVVLWGVWNGSMTVLLSTNRHARVAVALLLSGAATGAISVLAVPHLGIRGAALAGLLGDALVAGWYIPMLASREIGDSLAGFWGEIGVAILALAVPAALGAGAWVLAPWAGLRAPLALAAGGAAAAPLAWMGLSARERGLVRSVGRRLASRGGR